MCPAPACVNACKERSKDTQETRLAPVWVSYSRIWYCRYCFEKISSAMIDESLINKVGDGWWVLGPQKTGSVLCITTGRWYSGNVFPVLDHSSWAVVLICLLCEVSVGASSRQARRRACSHLAWVIQNYIGSLFQYLCILVLVDHVRGRQSLTQVLHRSVFFHVLQQTGCKPGLMGCHSDV